MGKKKRKRKRSNGCSSSSGSSSSSNSSTYILLNCEEVVEEGTKNDMEALQKSFIQCGVDSHVLRVVKQEAYIEQLSLQKDATIQKERKRVILRKKQDEALKNATIADSRKEQNQIQLRPALEELRKRRIKYYT